MGRPAAFFDLDRTLLRGASGPLLGEALATAGIVANARIPGQDVLVWVYETLGENLPSMLLARRAAQRAAGWSQAAVQEAGDKAAQALAELVQPFARPLLARHQRAGRPVVLATTSPYDLVTPLAHYLGFDDVVATRYGTDDEGRYTGGLEGEFVWGTGKRGAVERWAAAHDVDVASSWAYSDSVYDLPLLTAVRHPHAVNPDPRLWLVAVGRRWPVLYLDLPPGVPKVLGREPFRVLMPALRPELFPYARFRFEGIEHIPRFGPAIIVANHRSYFDIVALGLAIVKAGRPVRFLAKREVVDAPVIGPIARAMGAIRVDRGSGSDEPLEAAAEAIEGGEVVAIFPQGTIPRGEAFHDPVLEGRPGAARLAAMTRAPVIPVGIWGSERVWPRSARVPNVFRVLGAPQVEVRASEPVTLGYRDPHVDTRRIMQAVSHLLPLEARRRR